MIVRPIVAAALLALASSALAQETVVQLSPEQREKALEAAAVNGGAEPPINGLPGLSSGGRQVHGEVGAFIGTGGARGVFGSTVVPIGETGTAMFSFEKSRFGRNGYPYR